MSRVRYAAAMAGAMLAACSATPSAPPADLAGPNAMALMGHYLLVASTSSSQLRVLNATEKSPGFLRAPNPLYALSIPTAQMPIAVAASTEIATGNLFTAKLAFAASAITSKVTVASTANLARVGDIAVTAGMPLAITSPLWSGSESVEVVIGSVDNNGNGALSALAVKALVDSQKALDAPGSVVQTSLAALGPSMPQALVASPSLLNNPRLVVAGCRTAAGGGEVVFLNMTSPPTVTRKAVAGPVRALAFSPDGTRIFGVYDDGAHDVVGDGSATVFAFDVGDVTNPTPVTPGAILPNVPSPRGIAAGGSFAIPKASTAITSPLVVVASADRYNNLYLVDGNTLSLVLQSDGKTAYTVYSADISMPGPVVFIPGTGTDVGKDVFYAAFDGGNAVVRLEPDQFAAGANNGFTILR